MKSRERWQDSVNLVLGLWLVLSPFMPFMGIGTLTGVAALNSYIFGAIITGFALWALLKPQLWEEWINLVIGLWLIVAPFALGFASMSKVMWSAIIVGLLVAGDALWSMLKRPMGPKPQKLHHA